MPDFIMMNCRACGGRAYWLNAALQPGDILAGRDVLRPDGSPYRNGDLLVCDSCGHACPPLHCSTYSRKLTRAH